MKAKLLILGLFCWFGSFAQSVPNTNTFALSDVTSVVTGIGSNDLVECFAHAVDAYFDPTYKGSKNALYCFRNYTIPSIYPPTVTTTVLTDITTTTATGGGNVTADNGASVTARGICWSTTSTSPTTSDSHTSNGTGTGIFTSYITSLTGSVTYYVRAYATNSAGTAYGSYRSFYTASTSSVTTVSVTVTSTTTATAVGNVTSDGGAAVTERGMEWVSSLGTYRASSGTGTGSYTIYITGLQHYYSYYVRAYAINSSGTSYGSQIIINP